MRRFLLLVAVFLPLPLKRLFYRRIMGWQIAKNVRIGFSYLDADEVILDENVYIGHLNVIRCIKHFQIGNNTVLLNFNHLFGRRDESRWTSQLVIGEEVRFMSRHFIDACGTVTIGDRTTIGGRDSQIWSHGLTYETSEPMLSPLVVSIGADVYIGARATLVNCQIPAQAVVGAGSVVTKDFMEEKQRVLIAGNPAVIKKRYESGIAATAK